MLGNLFISTYLEASFCLCKYNFDRGHILLERICKNCGNKTNEKNQCCSICSSILETQNNFLLSKKNKPNLFGYFRYIFFILFVINYFYNWLVNFFGFQNNNSLYFYFSILFVAIAFVFFLVRKRVLPLVLPLAKYRKNNNVFNIYVAGDYYAWTIIFFIISIFIYVITVYISELSNTNNVFSNYIIDICYSKPVAESPLAIIVLFMPIILAIFGKLPYVIRRRKYKDTRNL